MINKKFHVLLLTIVLSVSLYGCQSTKAIPLQESTTESSAEVTTEPATSAETSQALPAATEAEAKLDGKYTLLRVDGGDMSGSRQSLACVDIGFGDREYWAYANEFGQLVRVTAAVIQLQDDSTEPVLESGRYYPDEADVPGTERSDLDQGHVIADSLGGVSNAYNITPQDSVLNQHGDQAYMEKVIRDAGGCTDFEAIITYADTGTQIPSHYDFTYTINGNVIHDSFDNVNPDMVNQGLNTPEPPVPAVIPTAEASTNDISAIDTNQNGQVSIKEAKAAGFRMPINRDHWLYQYMTDGDGDGMVGE